MRLDLTIALGNAAMQSRSDVEHAIHNSLTRRSDYASMHAPLRAGDDSVIFDSNGNTVGSWQVDAAETTLGEQAVACLEEIRKLAAADEPGVLRDIVAVLATYYGSND